MTSKRLLTQEEALELYFSLPDDPTSSDSDRDTDEDFAPELAPPDSDEQSSEAEAAESTRKPQKRKATYSRKKRRQKKVPRICDEAEVEEEEVPLVPARPWSPADKRANIQRVQQSPVSSQQKRCQTWPENVEVQTNELDDGSFRAALGDVRFDEYVAVDSNVETCGPLTDSEIVQMVRADSEIVQTPKKHFDTCIPYKTS
ncbi:hypothetical protein HPB51_020043 [Rhipicephalus microplus]|uniref:Uncharacterized protein n=1 Tax=Rhipicephalus microplus TaxID=6941 RepID=A0A9J6DWT6_RHIMP|nr:hypothetical protein HPB51_020043 [Rhipicephalus microplus]